MAARLAGAAAHGDALHRPGGRFAVSASLTDPLDVRWRSRAGFELRSRVREVGKTTWCELARDGLVVQFLGGDTPWEGPPALTGSLYVCPVDVDAVYADVKASIKPEWGIEERDWGTRELVLRDPNGYFVTFIEPNRHTQGLSVNGRPPTRRSLQATPSPAGLRRFLKKMTDR